MGAITVGDSKILDPELKQKVEEAKILLEDVAPGAALAKKI